jgi:hypothetical protein
MNYVDAIFRFISAKFSHRSKVEVCLDPPSQLMFCAVEPNRHLNSRSFLSRSFIAKFILFNSNS